MRDYVDTFWYVVAILLTILFYVVLLMITSAVIALPVILLWKLIN